MNSPSLTPQTIIMRSGTLLSSDLAGDIVMMDIERGFYYGLETVAARIWKLTEQPVAIGNLCQQILSEYEVSIEQCQQEVMTFLSELQERRIIQVTN